MLLTRALIFLRGLQIVTGVGVLAATAVCGTLQAVVGGQPLLIVGVAEPIVLTYQVCVYVHCSGLHLWPCTLPRAIVIDPQSYSGGPVHRCQCFANSRVYAWHASLCIS